MFETAGIAAYPTRARWDADAVELLGTVLARWNLTAGRTYPGGFSATVLEVTQEDGTPAVLKVGYPHEEAIAEAVALGAFPDGAAPRLLRQDPWAWAMLLERIEPGTSLLAAELPPEEALGCGAELLARIAAVGPVPGIPALVTVVRQYAAVARARWAEQLPAIDELGATELVDSALDELVALAADDTATAMVHGDFNPGNVLRSGEGWVAIDPKPMTGDACFDLWPLVSQLGSPFTRADPVAALARQLTAAAAASGCDPVRSARWAFARTGLNVTWYLQERNTELAAADVAALRVWAALREQVI